MAENRKQIHRRQNAKEKKLSPYLFPGLRHYELYVSPDFIDQIDIELIKDITCNYYKISSADILSGSTKLEIAKARHIIMFLTRKLTSLTLIDLSKRLNNKSHSTPRSAIRTVENHCDLYPKFKAEVVEIFKKIIILL